MFNFNAVLSKFSSTAVAVFGVCCRYTHLFYAVLNALCSTSVTSNVYTHLKLEDAQREMERLERIEKEMKKCAK